MVFKRSILKLLFLATCILLLTTVVHAENVEYIYDDAGRLIRTAYGDGFSVYHVIDYTYDGNGNRLKKAAGLSSIDISPLSHNFGTVPEGQSSSAATITISNSGNIGLELGDIIITGTHPSEFDIQNDLCSRQILDPAGSCTLEAIFSPATAGGKHASIEIISDDPNRDVAYIHLIGNEVNASVLTVGKNGTGAGIVTSDPAGIDCGTDCWESYTLGSVVTVTATPEENSTFDGWIGGECGTDPVCTVTLSADTTVVAEFNKRRPDLTVTQVSGTLNQDQLDITTTVKNEGNDVSVLARLGIYLSSDNVIDTSDILISEHLISTLAVDEEKVENISTNLPASFTGGQYYIGVIIDHQDLIVELDEADNALEGNTVDVLTSVLTVLNEGAGNGTISSDPGGITCGVDCTEEYITGLTVTLSVSLDDATSSFVGWSGACSGTGSCVVTMNTATSVTATFNTTLPDLRLTDVSFPVSVSPGETLVLPNTVINEGGGDASGFHVVFYLSDDPVITADDTSLGGRYVASLAAGASNSATTSFILSKTLTAGMFYIGAMADMNNAITESKESNNTTVGPVDVILSDLVMTEVSGPTTVSPGDRITVTDSVLNAGSGGAYGFYVTIYLSTDPAITTDDIRIWSRYIQALEAGAENRIDSSVTLPLTLEGGTYFLGAIVDHTDALNESVDDNNDLTGNQVDVIPSDLVMTDVSAPATGSPGTTITIANTVANIGAGMAHRFSVGLYLSTDNIITTSDIQIGWPYISSLAPGMDSSQNTTVTIPLNTVEGPYYVGAIADYNDGLSEADESNNDFVSTQQIQINYADLTMTSVSGPASANPGELITVSSMVRNNGPGNAAPSNIGLYLSDDPVITTSDTFIQLRNVGELGSGEENTGDRLISLSTALANGKYYLGAIADYNNTISETEEGNNAVTGDQIIIGKLLAVAKDGTGNGTVTSVPAGIDCGLDCDEVYSSGDVVTLTAVPDAMSMFAGWSGACSGTGDCVVTMNSDIIVTATFSPLSSYISVDPSAFDFGSIEVGTSSPEQNFVVSNISANDLDIYTITISGADAPEFTLLNDNCSNQTIPAGLNCTVQVQFSPSSKGNKSGVLSIPSSDPENPVIDVALNGLGYSNEGAYLIAGGYGHTGSIKQDATVWSSGLNQYGQLGDGTNVQKTSPVQAGADSNWMSVASGYYHTSALKDDGTLWSWGYNGYGQLGDGTNVAKNAPVQIGTDNNWAAIAAGVHHTVTVKSDGTLWAWGYNGYGQLGDGTTVAKNAPVQIGTDNNWVGVAAGMYHTVAVKSDGTLWAWGYNAYGQLGDGTTTGRAAPVQAGSDNDWQAISAGYYHSIATKTDGTLWTWGYNGYGQLGDGTYGTKNTPIQTGIDNDWLMAGGGYFHTIAVKTDGTLWAWGYNAYGQLGDGTNAVKNAPVQVGSDSDWTSVSTGAYHSLGIKTDGSVLSWGWNGYGQLGDGTTLSRNVPGLIVYP